MSILNDSIKKQIFMKWTVSRLDLTEINYINNNQFKSAFDSLPDLARTNSRPIYLMPDIEQMRSSIMPLIC